MEHSSASVLNCKAKLNENNVKRIRRLNEIFTTKELSKMFEVSKDTIRDIIKRKTWNHI
ncbi:MAG: hypothetical protein GF317_23480 [Candidatus Lokiarchaeota archaeon]|nr:hypothetical protein [Candidatus Lokiarchaeota archaeon]